MIHRSGLVFEVFRLIGELKPPFVFLENVPAIRTRGGERVCKNLARQGYDCRWDVISAAEVGACHIRKRWFLLAHSNCLRLREERRGFEEGRKIPVVPHGKGGKRHVTGAPIRKIKPSVGRTGDGIPFRVDRHRCLGGAVVPIQAQEAFKRLIGLV
jgi:DNA (cytosine-5)-methyltransferase 1